MNTKGEPENDDEDIDVDVDVNNKRGMLVVIRTITNKHEDVRSVSLVLTGMAQSLKNMSE